MAPSPAKIQVVASRTKRKRKRPLPSTTPLHHRGILILLLLSPQLLWPLLLSPLLLMPARGGPSPPTTTTTTDATAMTAPGKMTLVPPLYGPNPHQLLRRRPRRERNLLDMNYGARYANSTNNTTTVNIDNGDSSFYSPGADVDNQLPSRAKKKKFDILVLLIQFPEDVDVLDANGGKPPSDRRHIDVVLNGNRRKRRNRRAGNNGTDADVTEADIATINPSGSVRTWFKYNSIGRCNVKFTIIDWDVAPQTQEYYAGNVSGIYKWDTLRMQELFAWKLDKMDSAAYDWKRHDSDNDTIIDHVLVLHSGIPAEATTATVGGRGGGNSSGSTTARGMCSSAGIGRFNFTTVTGSAIRSVREKRIWSQGSAYPAPGGWESLFSSKMNSSSDMGVDKRRYRLGGYSIASSIGMTGDPCSVPAPKFDMGVALHELMHGIPRLPDLYDQDTDGDRPVHIAGLGNYDIMSNPFGWNHNARLPGQLSAWSRIRAGWLEPIEITRNGHYAIQPAEVSAVVYKISAGFPHGEYLLIENRQGIRWNSDWPSTGIIIYHVDEMAKGMTRRGYPGKRGWPADHYMVSVLQADGNYDLEKGVNLGDEGDFWNRKGMILGPNDDGKTWPNTDAYQNGVVRRTGCTISIMSDPGFIMHFKVDGLWNGGLFSPEYVPVDPPSTEATQPTSLTGDYIEGPIIGNSAAKTTGRSVAWILSVIGGAIATVGLMVFLVL